MQGPNDPKQCHLQVMMSAHLKHTLGVKSMIATGGQGYRAHGPYDPTAPIAPPHNNWMNNGAKGEDFNRNLNIKDIDLHTQHCYPDAWGIANTELE